jgi:hypothetical protein
MPVTINIETVERIALQGAVWGALALGVAGYTMAQGSPVPIVHDQSVHAGYYSNGGTVAQYHVDVDQQLSREYPAVRGGWTTQYYYRGGAVT